LAEFAEYWHINYEITKHVSRIMANDKVAVMRTDI